MIDPRAERQAYFASLATPDLIVCATVERTSFSAADLEIIQAELVRRGVDPTRLAQPGAAEAGPLWPTTEMYARPLPRTTEWWREGWQLFQRHLKFLALLMAILFIPEYILRNTVSLPHGSALSIGLLADTFLAIAFQALYTGAIMQALCRFMRTGHCSIGRAVSMGIERWAWVFTNMFKALAIALGVPYLLIALGGRSHEGGLVALGVILFIFPGIYLAIRYFWVQPIAALDPGSRKPLIQSKIWVTNNYGRIAKFIILGAVFIGLTAIGIAIITAILPGTFLDSLVKGYISALFQAFVITTMLVGYIHIRAERDTQAQATASALDDQLPPPPPLS